MKKVFSFFIFAILICSVLFAQNLQLPRVSQKATVMQRVGLTDVTIVYSRPGVKGREIWGGLVPYDKVWRTGANEATTLSVSTDVTIEGTKVPAGTYSLYTLPGKDEWTVILNKTSKQWGTNYDASQDLTRIKVKPQSGSQVEWMTFSFPEVSENSATLELAWEKLRLPIKIEAQTKNIAMANIQKVMSGDVKDPDVLLDAAEYAYNHDNQADAMKWVDRSIALKEGYFNLRLKADLLAKEGKKTEAIAIAEKAVKLGKENKDEPDEVAKTEKQIAEWKTSSGK
jgi:hypothetical protein